MRPYELPPAAVTLEATDTVQTIQEMVNAAISPETLDLPVELNYCKISPKTSSGSLLVLLDGNDPDNSSDPQKGYAIYQDQAREFKGVLNKIKIQRKSAINCKFTVQIGWTDAHGN